MLLLKDQNLEYHALSKYFFESVNLFYEDTVYVPF